METSGSQRDCDSDETELAAEFARLLAANFAREVPGRDADEDKSSHDSHEPKDVDGSENGTGGDGEDAIEGSSDAQGKDAQSKDRSLMAPANNRKGPRLASSRFRGCTRHRRTKRYEAHIWDQRQQRYLGGFDKEVDAGKAHDVMAIKCRNSNDTPQLNFPMSNYAELITLIDRLPKEEVVAQLRQLNRTAPRPKPRKPPTMKPRANASLAGLTTRSGGLTKRRVDSPLMIPESAMASFCRAQRLAPLKLGREPVMRLPMMPREQPYYKLAAGERMRSAFASQKDVPLPQWGPPHMGLDCPMSPDFSDMMHHLGDSSELLMDIHSGPLGSPALAGGVHAARHMHAQRNPPPGPLYVGRILDSPARAEAFLAREQQAALESHARSLPEPLRATFEQMPLSPTAPVSPTPGYDYSPHVRAAGPRVWPSPIERSLSLGGGSLRHGSDMCPDENGYLLERQFNRPVQALRPMAPDRTWQPFASTDYQEKAARDSQSLRTLQRGYGWEAEVEATSDYSGRQLNSPSPPSGQTAFHSPWGAMHFDQEHGHRQEGFIQHGGSQVGQPSFTSVDRTRDGLGPANNAADAPPIRRDLLLPRPPSSPLLHAFPRVKSEELFPLVPSDLSFTEMMAPDVSAPGTDQFDPAVLDVIGDWSP